MRTISISEIKETIQKAYEEGRFPSLAISNPRLPGALYVGENGTACAVGLFLSEPLRERLKVSNAFNSSALSSFLSEEGFRRTFFSPDTEVAKEIVDLFTSALPKVKHPDFSTSFGFWMRLQDVNDSFVSSSNRSILTLQEKRAVILEGVMVYLDRFYP